MADEKDTKPKSEADMRPQKQADEALKDNPHQPDPQKVTQDWPLIATDEGLVDKEGNPVEGETTHPIEPTPA